MFTNILLFIVSFLLGGAIVKILKPRKDGYMVVDLTHPDKDVYKLEMIIPFGNIHKKKYIILKVRDESEKSRK